MRPGLVIACISYLALISSICAREDGNDIEAIRRGDAYIDKLLEDISQNRVDEYDPYRIEDSVIGFHRKVVFVNVSGEAKLHDGYIKGLSTLHRPDHCSLYEEGSRLKVKAELGAGELEFHYSGSVKFMNYGPTITVQGSLSYIEVHMEFTVDSETGKNGKLDKFIIDDMRGMKVWVTGLGPLNWAVNPIIKGVTKIFKRFVRNFMEHKVEKHIAERLPNFQFPVEGGEETEPPVTEPVTSPTTEPESTPTEPETVPPTEPETVPPTEPQTNPPTEPETTATEPEINPPTEPETNPPEPETNPPEPETNPPEPETNPPEPETNPPEPETNPPEPETNPPEPETNPPEPETNPPEPEATPEEPEATPEEPVTPEEPETPEELEEIAFLEPDRANEKFSNGDISEDSSSSEENSEEIQYDSEGLPEDKYMSFIEE